MPFRCGFERLDDPPELVHDLGGETDLAQPLVHPTVPAYRSLPADVEAAPDGVGIDRSFQIGDDGPGIVQLVGRTHPPCRFAGPSEPLEVVVFPLLIRQLGTVVVERSLRDRKYGVEDVHAELVTNALPEHVTGVMLPDAVFDDVVEDAGDHGIFVAAITSEDDRNVARMRQVRQPGALPNLTVVVL